MKINYKKIGSILASGIMFASTLGFAAAASFPEPFVASGAENGAVVVGVDAATSDWAAAIDVQTNLNALVSSSDATAASVSGGESFLFEMSSTKLQMGRGLKDVIGVDLGEDDLPTILNEGKYVDDDNDEFDYEQKFIIGNHTLGIFDDDDYMDDAPTIGVRIANSANVLNYTIDFTDEPLWSDLATSTMPIMDKNYYVLSINSTSVRELTLLDSAVDIILNEGETSNIVVGDKTYSITVDFIANNQVKMTIDGDTTNTLAATETQKLGAGAYIGIREILYSSKDTGVSKVEFSIGSGKLKLKNNSNIELNEKSVSGLRVRFKEGTDRDYLGQIELRWNANDDQFIAPDSEILMPGFGSVKLSWGGMIYSFEEEIRVESDGENSIQLKDFPLKDGLENINILYWNDSHYVNIGKDASNMLRTPGGQHTTGTSDIQTENGTVTNITFDSDTDDYFVASWNDSTSAESYLMKADDFTTTSGKEYVSFYYKKAGVWTNAKLTARNGTTFTLGNAQIKVQEIDDDTNKVIIKPGTGTSFRNLYSKQGLQVVLPWVNRTGMVGNTANVSTACRQNLTAASNEYTGRGMLGVEYRYFSDNNSATVTCNNMNSTATYDLIFHEQNKDGTLGVGRNINLTLAGTSVGADAYVSDIVGESAYLGTSTTTYEIGDTDVHRAMTYGPLATEMLWDKSTDQYSVKLIYHGDEAYGQILLTTESATITPGTSATSGGGQVLVVKDSEVSSVAGKNLVVVGGSCINKVAAKILDSSTPICTSAFTTATGVGSGQYIIKTVTSPYNDAKVAMLVAGYDAADTVNAVAKAIAGATSDADSSQVYPIVSA